MAGVGVSTRVDNAATTFVQWRLQGSGEAYFDDLRAYELGVVSASTATKQLPTRIAFSVSNPGSPEPYVALGINGSEQAEAWASDDDGTQTGPAGGDTVMAAGWHTIGMGFDGTDLFVTVDGVKESTVVQPSGDFDNLSATTIGALRVGEPLHFLGIGANADLGRVAFWNNPLTVQERLDAHNYLRREYTGLAEA